MKKIVLDEKLLSRLEGIVSKFKNYKCFSANKKRCYEYTSLFGVSVCPYCNIHYIHTIEGVSRPSLDHFAPKSTSPKGELDPRNLVPSCGVCNSSIKGAAEISAATHIHPFVDDFDSIVRFCINLIGHDCYSESSFDIDFHPIVDDAAMVNKAMNSILFFKFRERYACHKKTVVNHLRLIAHYGEAKRREISDICGLTACGNRHLDILIADFFSTDINNTSLGKLKKDIYMEYLRF